MTYKLHYAIFSWTEEETGNVDAVMDGALDGFINAYLKWIHRPVQEA